jgi:hypothetical protein
MSISPGHRPDITHVAIIAPHAMRLNLFVRTH